LRVLFDKNVPIGGRQFLLQHEVCTFVEMQWHPQLENGELLQMAEVSQSSSTHSHIYPTPS
jgi:hypothetical protein